MRGRLSAAAAASIAAALFLAPPVAAEEGAAGVGHIKGLRLGMSLPDGEIEGVYQSTLAAEIDDSVGLRFPFDHIETKLIDGSRLSLHFSSAEDGARLFWVRLATSWRWPVERPSPALPALLTEIEQRFGAPSRSAGARDGGGDLLLVFAAAGTSADLPQTIDLAPEEIGGTQFMSFHQRVELFGRDFVGAVVTIVQRDGEVVAVVEELADHRRGATVLNPGPDPQN